MELNQLNIDKNDINLNKELRDFLYLMKSGSTLEIEKEDIIHVLSNFTNYEVITAGIDLLVNGKDAEDLRLLLDAFAEFYDEIEFQIDFDHEEIAEGHPLRVFHSENMEALYLLDHKYKEAKEKLDKDFDTTPLLNFFNIFKKYRDHLGMKQSVWCSFLEINELTVVTQVLFERDRALGKAVKLALDSVRRGVYNERLLNDFEKQLRQNIAIENSLFVPALFLNTASPDYRFAAAIGEETGYFIFDIDPSVTKKKRDQWMAENPYFDDSGNLEDDDIYISTGTMTTTELEHLLRCLPINFTFICQDRTIQVYNETNKTNTLFTRNKGAIGRYYKNCLPFVGSDLGNKAIDLLESGERDMVPFMFKRDNDYYNVALYAVRNETDYIGTLEVVEKTSYDAARYFDIIEVF